MKCGNLISTKHEECRAATTSAVRESVSRAAGRSSTNTTSEHTQNGHSARADGVSKVPSDLVRKYRLAQSSVRRLHFSRLLCCVLRRQQCPQIVGAAADWTPFLGGCGQLCSLYAAAQRARLAELALTCSFLGRQGARTYAADISAGAVAVLCAFSSPVASWFPDRSECQSRAPASALAILTATHKCNKLPTVVLISMRRVMGHGVRFVSSKSAKHTANHSLCPAGV